MQYTFKSILFERQLVFQHETVFFSETISVWTEMLEIDFWLEWNLAEICGARV
jgi:hypothetical protein